MSEEGINLMLDFARCLNTSELLNCSATRKFHSINGTCNNLLHPTKGAANTAFKRLQPAEYEDGISLPVVRIMGLLCVPFIFADSPGC